MMIENENIEKINSLIDELNKGKIDIEDIGSKEIFEIIYIAKILKTSGSDSRLDKSFIKKLEKEIVRKRRKTNKEKGEESFSPILSQWLFPISAVAALVLISYLGIIGINYFGLKGKVSDYNQPALSPDKEFQHLQEVPQVMDEQGRNFYSDVTDKRYVLNINLPSFPGEMVVYKNPHQQITSTRVKELAEKLGMHGEVIETDMDFKILEVEDEQKKNLIVEKINGWFHYFNYGLIAEQSKEEVDLEELGEKKETTNEGKKEALLKAIEVLKKLDVMPDKYINKVSYEEEIYSVRIFPLIEEEEVINIIYVIDLIKNGNIFSINALLNFFPKFDSSIKLKDIEVAFEEMNGFSQSPEKNGMEEAIKSINDSEYEVIYINQINLVYSSARKKDALDTKDIYFYPVYELKGEDSAGNEFLNYIPAIEEKELQNIIYEF